MNIRSKQGFGLGLIDFLIKTAKWRLDVNGEVNLHFSVGYVNLNYFLLRQISSLMHLPFVSKHLATAPHVVSQQNIYKLGKCHKNQQPLQSHRKDIDWY